MQEIKKSRIVLASVLKPVDDPRMFEKMGQSLAREYDVHIFGTSGKTPEANDGIHFHHHSSYSRFGHSRILAPLKIFSGILRIRPAVVIVNTHELLWMVIVLKMVSRCKIIYDIRENYYRNILYTTAFPSILKPLIAGYVRIKEWCTRPFIDQYLLAEAGYANELPFLKGDFEIVENKVKAGWVSNEPKWSSEDGNLHLLFSGTLSPTTGVFAAIKLASQMNKIDSSVRLHLVGFSPMKSVLQEIKREIRDKPFIIFETSDAPVPHIRILEAIKKADAGIIAYPPNPSTANTIPTKLFEYLGYQLPIILINHPPWVERCQPFNAAIPFDPEDPDPADILKKLHGKNFYIKVPENVFWTFEEPKFLQIVAKIANKAG